MQKNNILFLIRTYNEWSRIRTVIDGIFAAGFSQILVVDDGSTDDTDLILADLIEDKKISYICHPINRWAGAALETGFEYARRFARDAHWKYVVTFDADGQHDVKDMDVFMKAYEKNPKLDVVLGSRFIIKTNSNVPFIRRMILWWGKIFTSFISGISLTDAHNGYRMFRVASLQKISLTMDGMEYASELIDQISSNHFHYQEVPVNIHYDSYTLAKGQRMGGAWRVMTRMIAKKFF